MNFAITNKPSLLPALAVFVAVARALNFSRAAVELQVSSAAVSKTIKHLEATLGARLLNRTTRSVSLTDAGRQLLSALEPALASVESAIEQVQSAYDQPSGELRLNTSQVAYASVIEPYLATFLKRYPALSVEISIDNALSDIVGDGYDVGLRLGHTVQQDMIGLRIGRPQQRVVVAAPEYLQRYGVPSTPQQLIEHTCIRQRLHTKSQLYGWFFQIGNRNQQVNVHGSVVFDEMRAVVAAACNGLGLAYVFRQFAATEIDSGKLQVVLEPFSPPTEPYYFYYPHRSQMPAKLRVFLDYFKAANAGP